MFIFILILIGGAAGYGFYWFNKKKEECQAIYNQRFSKVREEFDNCKNYSDFYERMGECILKADDVFSQIVRERNFPNFVIVRINVNYDGMHAMYKELLQKLSSEFEKTFDFKAALEVIKKMQEAVKFVRHTGYCNTTIEDNKKITQLYYTKVQEKLKSEFYDLLSSNASIEQICEKLQNMQESKQLVNYSQDPDFVTVINAYLGLMNAKFTEVQNKLDNDFKDIAREFLTKTTYESVLSSIWKVIEDNNKFIEMFANYELKPDDNSKQISYMRSVSERVDTLHNMVVKSDDCYMIADDEYGKCEEEFLKTTSTIDAQLVKDSVDSYWNTFENGDFEKIISVDLKLLSTYVWYFAMLKPFSTEDFEKISKLYNGFFKNVYTAEILLAELYYIKQMGGDTVIRNKINDLLDEKNGRIREMIKYNVVLDKVGDNKIDLIAAIRKNTNASLEQAEKIVNGHTSIIQEAIDYNKASSMMYDLNRTGALISIKYHHNTSSKLLTTIASGLMWIGAYASEKQVLEYMLSKQLPMSQKQQERLHSLNNGGGDAPKGHAVTSSEEKLYFDISSISWHDDEYKGFFENLAFEEKILQYSVAVRDEDKELMISKRVKLPEQTIVLDKIKSVFEEEYGDTVTAKICHCCALSGTNQENLEGILVQSNECKQLGVLVHMACIGKKFTIKFFSLFMPEVKDLNEQKQQLLSLYKKMSPSVTMWENSLKDTILIAFQQLLNELPSSNTVVTNGNDVEF